MATNTNYTTKTAALKATKADMRQVQVSKKLTSKEVWIDDAEGKSTDVLELIGKAEDINDEVKKYRNVTAEDIQRVARETFVKENCCTLYYNSKQ